MVALLKTRERVKVRVEHNDILGAYKTYGSEIEKWECSPQEMVELLQNIFPYKILYPLRKQITMLGFPICVKEMSSDGKISAA